MARPIRLSAVRSPASSMAIPRPRPPAEAWPSPQSASGASPVGSYAVNGSGLSAGNYVFAQAAGNSTALTINPAILAYTADQASRAYGTANPVFTGTVTGFVNGETQSSATTGTLTFTSPATSASAVGTYAINGSGLSASNYTFVQAAGNANALTINPAMTLTYVADPASRIYGAANPAFTGSVNRLCEWRHPEFVHQRHAGLYIQRDGDERHRQLCDHWLRPDVAELRFRAGRRQQHGPDDQSSDAELYRGGRQPALRGSQPGLYRKRDGLRQWRHPGLGHNRNADLHVPRHSGRCGWGLMPSMARACRQAITSSRRRPATVRRFPSIRRSWPIPPAPKAAFMAPPIPPSPAASPVSSMAIPRHPPPPAP